MEQRPLRLGDLVDDYCPRERRVTNHAIVALVGEAIRQTRCTTCDTEHVFKAGRLPRRRAKDEAGDGVAEQNGHLAVPVADDATTVYAASEATEVNGNEAAAETLVESSQTESAEPLWPANRTLIRATLPRVEGEQPPPRPIPEFTLYQRHQGRHPGGFRRSNGSGSGGGGGWRGGPEPNGNRAGGNDRRGNGNGAGFGGGGGQGQGGRRRHGKRRPR